MRDPCQGWTRIDGARDDAIDAREQRLTTTMVAVTIAAHIGRRSELGDGDGMMFRGCLIRADYMRAPMTLRLVAVRR